MATEFVFPSNFSLAEFQAASDAPLSREQIQKALELAWLLQPARDVWGPIAISSFFREGDDGCHGLAEAVDAIPLEASVEAVFVWMADNLPEFGELIQERDHVHVTRLGCGGRFEVLREPREGRYIAGFATPLTIGLLALVAGGAWFGYHALTGN